jgi:hypothetical protein
MASQRSQTPRGAVLLVTGTFANNQLGRAHSLWLALQALGRPAHVATIEAGEIWFPLRGTEFASQCFHGTFDEIAPMAAASEVIVAVKTHAASLGVAARLGTLLDRPVVADIDDPDLEVQTWWSRRTRTDSIRHMHRHRRELPQLLSMRRLARRFVRTVSNPVLQARYGGELVPHARPDLGFGAAHTASSPTVAFVGTPREHKGLRFLRAAVDELADEGWRLLVTANPPRDAKPWEQWVGISSYADGERYTAEADVVALPSEDYHYGKAQLPMKLVDAMLAGRAIAVSDAGPLPWALAGAGEVFRSGSTPALLEALRPLADPATRTRLGREARAVALSRYTPGVVAPALERALRAAGGDRPSR